MRIVKCPNCGSSEIAWDSKTGDVICQHCGFVIDKIYHGVPYYDDERVSYYLDEEFLKKLKRVKEWKERIENAREKKMVFYNGALIKESSLPALKLIESDERLLILYDIIDSMYRTRSAKTKLALALYFYDRKELEKYKKLLGISDKYMEKVLSQIKEKEKIREAIKKRFSSSLY